MIWNIVSDSSCDLRTSAFHSDRVLFHSVPLRIQVGDQEFVDNDDLSVPEMLRAMAAEKSASSSACPSPADFAKAFEAGDCTVCFTISSNLSGTYNSAIMARDMVLEAAFENGARVQGESKICDFKKAQDCRIESVRLLPEHPQALPEAVRAIQEADLILLGPGSLYTSVIPNLLVDGISEAVCASKATKIYICNIMTQDGETEGMTASDHVKALLRHSGPGLVNICLCNSAPVRPGLVARYKAEDAVPIVVDKEAIEALGVELVTRPLASETLDYARHSFARLAAAVMELYEERASTRVL